MPPPTSSTSAPLPSNGCPASTVTPDANGWVPTGTCGYLSRPYYPSFVAAVIFSAAAATILALFVRKAVRLVYWPHSRGGSLDECTPSPRLNLMLPPILISACLLVAYVLRAIGTKHQQAPVFVGISDTLALVCPTAVFAFDHFIFVGMVTIANLGEGAARLRSKAVLHAPSIIIPLLVVQQFIASLLIAPKHRPNATSGASSTAMTGIRIYLFTIGVQELVLLYSLTLATIFHLKSANGDEMPHRQKNDNRGSKGRKLQQTSSALLISLCAILTRVSYRLIELSGLLGGYFMVLAHNEVFFYTLDCLPVLVALGVWTFVDTESLLYPQISNSSDGDTYSYHEISGGFVDHNLIGLAETEREE